MRRSSHPPPVKGIVMAFFKVQPFEYFGDPAILVSADREGMGMLQSAVRSAHERGTATFQCAGVSHRVQRQEGAADLQLSPRAVEWRFDDHRLTEILDLIEPLVDGARSGHQYVDDLHSPVETLVLSMNEHEGGSPYGDFPELG